MAAGGPVDPTMPLPGERRGAPVPDEPTATGGLPGAYDPTVAVPPVGPPDDPYGPPPGGGDEGPDRRWLWGVLAALGVIILGVVIALLLTNGDDNGDRTAATSTTSSSTSTSTSTSTTSTSTTTTPPTTVPNAPAITTFTANPSPFPCTPPNGGQITLNWNTTNATGVTVSIDGPGVYASYGPNGSEQVPFAGCNQAHAYTLTAKGEGNQQAQQTITVQAQPATTTTSAPTTTTTS